MANRYWVGDGGNWSDTGHWSTTSGGSSGAAVPTSSDDVYFDANSFSTTSQTVTLTASASCGSFVWTGATNSPTFDMQGYSISIYGTSVTLISAMTLSSNAYQFKIYGRGSGAPVTLTTAGKTIPGYYLIFRNDTSYSNSVLNLADDLTQGTISGGGFEAYGAVTVNTNNHNINVLAALNFDDTVTFNCGTSTITSGGSIDIGYSTYSGPNNLSASSATFVMTGTAYVGYFFMTQYQTIGTLHYTGSGRISHGGGTINNLTIDPGVTLESYSYTVGSTNVGNITLTGTPSSTITLTNRSGFTDQYGFVKTSGTVTASYCNVDHIAVSGGATWIAGDGFIDNGDNSGWTYVNTSYHSTSSQKYRANTRHWVGGSGNWSDTSHWSISSGGAGGASVPISSENVYFDENSFTSSGQTVTIDATANAKSIDWTGVTNTPTLAGSAKLNIYGSLTLVSGMNVTYNPSDSYLGFTFLSSTTDNTITTAGKTIGGLLYFNNYNGKWTLQDDYTNTTAGTYRGISINAGTLDTNGNDLTVSDFMANPGSSGAVFGSSTLTISNSFSAPYALDAGTSTIVYSGYNYFSPRGKTFYNVSIRSSSSLYPEAVIDGSGTYYSLSFTSTSYQQTFRFLAGSTQTILNSISFDSNATYPMTLESLTAGTQFTINKTSGDVVADYLNIQDSNATGGANFYAGNNSVNNSNNTGWMFYGVPPTVDVSSGYSVAAGKTTNKTASYTIPTTHDMQFSAKYVAIGATDKVKVADYSIISSSTIDKSSTYNTVKAPTILVPSSYRVKSSEELGSSTLKRLKIGDKYGPITAVVLGRQPQNDNILLSNISPEATAISLIDIETNTITVMGHGMVDGTLVRVSSDDTLPSPLEAEVNYFVYTNGNNNTFSLANSYADALSGTNIIDITTQGSGTITLSKIGTEEVYISNNQIADDDREILLPNIYSSLVGSEWNEVEAETIGLGWHEVGDVIKFSQGDISVNGFISEIHLTLDGSVKEKIVSVIPDVQNVDYQTAGGIVKKLYNTEIKVDKQENDITSIVSQQTIYENSVQEDLTRIYQDLENILLTVQRSGGGNLIKNSVGFATVAEQDASTVQYDKLDSWTYNPSYDVAADGYVLSYTSSDSQNHGGVSGQTIEMAGADVYISQTVSVAAATPISFGMRVKNEIGDGDATIDIYNDNDSYQISINDTESYDWEELKIENMSFTMPWVTIKISVSSAANFRFTDSRLMYGTSLQSWVQSASEILSTNVQFTENGMKIFDNIHDTETQVTYNEFSTRRKKDGVVLFEADDSGVVANDLSIKGETSYINGSTALVKQITIPESSAMAGIAFIKAV